jgi:integrase
MSVPILVKGTRILRPSEYLILRNELNDAQKLILDSLLLTGMRYEELLRFHNHPDWFDGSSIHLPADAVLKGRAIKDPDERQRWVRLSIKGKAVVEHLHRVSIPGRVSFDQMLRRKSIKAIGSSPGFNPLKISAKSMRKTYTSWLRAYYPNMSDYIFLSMGHSSRTELRHYLGIPFTEEDKRQMREWVEGWA